jgi:NTE family protein
MEKAETPAQRIARELAEGTREPKLGLALSGGGFRAAFFHVGVLARLADAGLLRGVRVISTVSGGAIVGALYYLHVLRLLESKADGSINDLDYREIVEQIARDFPVAVARNVRGRAVVNPLKNFAMALFRGYSRTYRIAELYERFFYAGIWENARGHESAEPRRFVPELRIAMPDLLIRPHGWAGDTAFDPDKDNEGRNAAVPILLINAASLNSGHNWRFEARYMGEPDVGNPAVDEADKNTRFARTRYDQLPEHLQRFKLGAAVAAAAAFPILCRPVDIRDLFVASNGKQVTVKLMDGGAHDNQGVEGLLDRDCTHLIVSDGAGQMGDAANPGHYIPQMVERASGMMFDHARELQVIEAFSTLPTAFMHLMKGLEAPVQRPVGLDPLPPKPPPELTTAQFGVADESQRLIAEIRTDLDAFSETEANSLMLDGYLMAEAELDRTPAILAFGTPLPLAPDSWPFESIAPWLTNPTDRYRVQLRAATRPLLKPARQSRVVASILAIAALLALAGAVLVLWQLWSADLAWSPVWTVGALLTAAAIVFLYLSPVRFLSFLLFDRLFPFLIAPVVPVVAFVFLLEGWVYRRLGKQSRL